MHCMMPADEEEYDKRNDATRRESEAHDPESDGGGDDPHAETCGICAVGNQDLTEGTEPVLREIYHNHKIRAPFYPEETNSAITAKDFNSTCFESNKRLRDAEKKRSRGREGGGTAERRVPKLRKWTPSQVREHYEEHDRSDKKKYLERDVEHCDRAQRQMKNTCLWKRDFDEERGIPTGPVMPNVTNYNLWLKLGQHKLRTLALWHKMDEAEGGGGGGGRRTTNWPGGNAAHHAKILDGHKSGSGRGRGGAKQAKMDDFFGDGGGEGTNRTIGPDERFRDY